MIFKLDHWLEFPFVIPPIAEQRVIGAVLSAADTEINLLLQRVAFLTKQKQGLMQQLLTSDGRVNKSPEFTKD
jgi:type I restriction enzyme S subunit